ncbi:MAG: hypothetical protein ACKO2L_15875 [Planctomycetaceae bacterium]
MTIPARSAFPVSSLRFLFRLLLVLLAGWLVAYWPAGVLHQASGVLWLSLAALLMFCSGLAGLALVKLLKKENTLTETFLHSANRSLWVLVAVVLVRTLQPQIGFSKFYGWLIFFYLQLMVLEVLTLQGRWKKPS